MMGKFGCGDCAAQFVDFDHLETHMERHHSEKNIEEEHFANGISKTVQDTGLRGRWEVLSEQPLTICDTGHNPEGIAITVQQLLSYSKPLHIVFGMVVEKDQRLYRINTEWWK